MVNSALLLHHDGDMHGQGPTIQTTLWPNSHPPFWLLSLKLLTMQPLILFRVPIQQMTLSELEHSNHIRAL